MKKNNELKVFFIKLISITFAFIFIINFLFNLLLAERLEKIDKLLSINKAKNRSEIKDKIRIELLKGLEKDNLLSEEDKILLYKYYIKLKSEFNSIDSKIK
ncbi:hypothetical protein [Candidatus Fonsibacter ubiquis]|jgi:hypothetical protein|uniref:hypothetical protein n=1 Tax=Candidatus Fonsibacter ubiquis TaxID=1925548 RepID=UPI000C072589|nr:hypothetical protein [Candidatus Fonsibacter ubiquis]